MPQISKTLLNQAKVHGELHHTQVNAKLVDFKWFIISSFKTRKGCFNLRFLVLINSLLPQKEYIIHQTFTYCWNIKHIIISKYNFLMYSDKCFCCFCCYSYNVLIILFSGLLLVILLARNFGPKLSENCWLRETPTGGYISQTIVIITTTKMTTLVWVKECRNMIDLRKAKRMYAEK